MSSTFFWGFTAVLGICSIALFSLFRLYFEEMNQIMAVVIFVIATMAGACCFANIIKPEENPFVGGNYDIFPKVLYVETNTDELIK